LAAHPRREVRFSPELASNLVVIVNKTYARNHVLWTKERKQKQGQL
jgi:hypothetical protein